MLVPVAHRLAALFIDAARQARRFERAISLDDLMHALMIQAPLGDRLADAVLPQQDWGDGSRSPGLAELAIWADDEAVPFNLEAERLVLEGARAVLLGPYEPRHLAESIGRTAELHPERFRRFGFDSRAWRRALQVRTVDH